jgi:hypothetical protein
MIAETVKEVSPETLVSLTEKDITASFISNGNLLE